MKHQTPSRVPWRKFIAISYALAIFTLVFIGRKVEAWVLDTVHPLVLATPPAVLVPAICLFGLSVGLLAWRGFSRLFSSLGLATVLPAAFPRVLICLGAFCLLIFFSVSIPGTPAEYAHLPIYAGLSMLTAVALDEKSNLLSLKNSCHVLVKIVSQPMSFAFILSNLVSFGDEALQWLHPQRFFDIRDLVLNFIGILWGLLLFSGSAGRGLKAKVPPPSAPSPT